MIQQEQENYDQLQAPVKHIMEVDAVLIRYTNIPPAEMFIDRINVRFEQIRKDSMNEFMRLQELLSNCNQDLNSILAKSLLEE